VKSDRFRPVLVDSEAQTFRDQGGVRFEGGAEEARPVKMSALSKTSGRIEAILKGAVDLVARGTVWPALNGRHCDWDFKTL